MKIKTLPHLFSICKLKSVENDIFNKEFSFLSVTDEEISLVCKTEDIPENVISRKDTMMGFRIEGTLDFSLIGILAEITTALAEAKVPVFAISTYNTDYIFIEAKHSFKAKSALKSKGYEI